MVNFGLLAAEIVLLVWGTPANFNGFRLLAALLHGTVVVGVSQFVCFIAALDTFWQNPGRNLFLPGPQMAESCQRWPVIIRTSHVSTLSGRASSFQASLMTARPDVMCIMNACLPLCSVFGDNSTVIVIASSQSNLIKRLHLRRNEPFSHIRQVAPMCTPISYVLPCSWTHLSPHPKRYLDPFSGFAGSRS